MTRMYRTLEFDIILERLAEIALSDRAKEMALSLAPTLSEAECLARLRETTGARAILEALGTPPLSPMKEIRKTLALCQADAMLTPEQLSSIALFLNTCGRAAGYLRRAETIEHGVSSYGRSLNPLPDLYGEIDVAIRGDTVDDQASPGLRQIRRRMEACREGVKGKLDAMLRSRRECFSESFVVQRGDRFALPVKKEHRSQIAGTVLDISSSGNTVFIEPTQARKLTDELLELSIQEDNEIRRVLYTLTALVQDALTVLRVNVECMETLDFLFAKARLSAQMRAVSPTMTVKRCIAIHKGRHPLLKPEACVPLDFEIGGALRGVVITGPNTGGKTVALKTVGLLSLMAQSGLHVPAEDGSVFSLNANVLCDIGDGQSISENLSTFSSHMTEIIHILEQTRSESLVLLDELGSGTDPAEGMGLAVAILTELKGRGCLFVATSHYPEIKDFAAKTEGLTNARMTFDRDSLQPLYQLEMGEAGESCALFIAKRLGLPEHLLAMARGAAYGEKQDGTVPVALPVPKPSLPAVRQAQAPAQPRAADKYRRGDSVRIYPQRDIGIVYAAADEKGMVGVMVQKKKLLVNHKRLSLVVAAEELYPDDYDFSIVFDTVANRKARKVQTKRHDTSAIVRYEEEEDTQK